MKTKTVRCPKCQILIGACWAGGHCPGCDHVIPPDLPLSRSQDDLDWEVFAEKFEKRNGFMPLRRDKQHLEDFYWFTVGAHAQFMGRLEVKLNTEDDTLPREEIDRIAVELKKSAAPMIRTASGRSFYSLSQTGGRETTSAFQVTSPPESPASALCYRVEWSHPLDQKNWHLAGIFEQGAKWRDHRPVCDETMQEELIGYRDLWRPHRVARIRKPDGTFIL